MPSEPSGLALCVALALAATAAIVSTPGRAEKAYETLAWLQLSAAPEADAMAAAIGEQPPATQAR